MQERLNVHLELLGERYPALAPMKEQIAAEEAAEAAAEAAEKAKTEQPEPQPTEPAEQKL